ncbi:ImmA/IrrE family metallo-endopeptidase [Wenyingzhuangia sp. IMCC45574]
MKSIASIESKAVSIIKEFGDLKTPINVEQICRNMGIEIKCEDLGENVSGVLFIKKDGSGVIGYDQNNNISEVRKRFSIAHELGHYVLHRFNQELFVDHKQFKAIFRDNDSSKGDITQEREANAFAAALLMPKEKLNKALSKHVFDLADSDENIIDKLAKKFNVSSQAMTYRIAKLRLFA